MHSFRSYDEARLFISETIDQPITPALEQIRPGVSLTMSVLDKGNDQFTNIYDLAFDSTTTQPEIIAFDNLMSVYEFFSRIDGTHYTAATSGGFFYLADQGSGSPRQLALNLSISQGSLRSLPVADRETVIAEGNKLEVRSLIALGSLTINGHNLDWSGSMTDYDTESKVYSNGNAVITHQHSEVTGTIRVLDETSRYTPTITHDDFIDVGFIGRGGNEFVGVESSSTGAVDIFAHDFVIRCPQRYIEGVPELQVQTIGGIALERFEGGAFSAGPNLNIADFGNHPINQDSSLGSKPPFIDTNMARTALFKSQDGQTHIRLFDGRPGSTRFPGVTPSEAVSQILDEGEIEWGCFLDPGQTVKLCVSTGDGPKSYGNRHYLRWPSEASSDFFWVPDAGRPVANVIAL